jgi:predicted permease
MSATPMWRRYLRFWGADPPADVDAEIDFHVEALVQHYVARGMPPGQARREAACRFGDIARVREECVTLGEASLRTVRRRQVLDSLWHDINDAARSLRKNPGFTAGAALILALGIGINTTIYSFNAAVLVPTVPLGDASRLVRLWAQNLSRGVYVSPLSEADAADLAAGSRSLASVAAFAVQPMTLTTGTEVERITALRSTPNLLTVLQASPAAGRDFTAADADAPGNRVAIISHLTWQRRFGADPSVLGRDLHLDGQPYTIVGVMPERFWFESREIEAFLPMPTPSSEGAHSPRALMVIARLAPGVDGQAAQADVQDIAERMAATRPDANEGWGVLTTGLLPLGPGEKVFFAFVVTLTGLLLAAACAHIANLLLARGMERRGEMAIRAALGAGRRRILRQLFAENVALAIVGGSGGLLIAWPLVAQIRATLGPRTPFLSELSLDGGALAVAAALTILTSLLFGLAPGLRLSSITAGDAMKQPPGGPVTTRRRRPLASLLIGLEVAIATLALIVTFLFVRAAANVMAIPFGFDPDRVMTFRIEVPEHTYPQASDAARVLSAIHERVRQLPSVTAAGASVRLPLYVVGPGLPTETMAIEDRPSADAGQEPWAITQIVTPGYFEALRIRLLAGRTFDARDAAVATPVAVVSRSTARAYWPDQDATGKRVRLGGGNPDQPWLTVVGVVDDVRPVDPTSPQVRHLYLPLAQSPVRALTYFVSTPDDPTTRVQEIRQAVHDMDVGLPVLDLRPLASVIDDQLNGQRLVGASLQVIAAIAIALAVTGVYSLVAFASARRRREIAIRMAMGGTRRAIVGALLLQTLRPALIGVAVGLVMSALASRALALILFGVNPLDPVVYGGAALGLTMAVVLASSAPALRATRLDAAAALRCE